MPAWPKPFYTFGAGMLTALAEWQLRKKTGAVAAQERTFARLTKRMSATSWWREAGVEPGTDYKTFAARLAPRTYEHFAPAIERVKRGEGDVLWPGPCSLFAVSSGTTAGPTKYLPVTEEMLTHFRQAGRDSVLYYTVRARNAGVFRGRHLLLGGSTALVPIAGANPPGAFAGDVSGIMALNLPRWVEKHLYEPGAEIAQMTDWSEKIDAIVARTRSLDITMLAGIPSWMLILAAALKESSTQGKRRLSNLQGLWPNLECFMHCGTPIAPFYDELRTALAVRATRDAGSFPTLAHVPRQVGWPAQDAALPQRPGHRRRTRAGHELRRRLTMKNPHNRWHAQC